MPRKTYTEAFKRDAVSLHESTPGTTINAIASALGINRNSLRSWLGAFGTGIKTNDAGEKSRQSRCHNQHHRTQAKCFHDH